MNFIPRHALIFVEDRQFVKIYEYLSTSPNIFSIAGLGLVYLCPDLLREILMIILTNFSLIHRDPGHLHSHSALWVRLWQDYQALEFILLRFVVLKKLLLLTLFKM